MYVPDSEPDNDPGGVVGSLCRRLPEFAQLYRRRAEACGDEPGEPDVLMELAEFVSSRMAALETERSRVDLALATIEAHLDSIAGDRIGCELVAFAFFDSFSPEERRRLGPRLGAHSRALCDGLDMADTEWESAR